MQYADLVRDPVGTVAASTTPSATELRTTARGRAIAAYVDAHPKGKFGTHGYDLAEFGLDRRAVPERFAGYVDRYDVARET